MLQRPARTLLAAVLLAGLAACSSDDTGGGAAQEVDGPVATGVQPGATLTGTLGSPEDPDEFTIGLVDASGAAVTTVPAGDYTIVVDDQTRIHNWAMSGQGVNAATEVAGTGESTFEVTFVAGDYSYVCDPHPSMSGTLTVT